MKNALIEPMKMKMVLSYEFVDSEPGRECLAGLETTRKEARRYNLDKPIHLVVKTDVGTLHVKTLAGFIFDGRSGPEIVDRYVPNLGSIDERVAWLMHDALGYGQSLAFKPTNRILRYFLRDVCKYSPVKSWLVEFAVGSSHSWYGPPKKTEWCYANVGRVDTMWVPSLKGKNDEAYSI